MNEQEISYREVTTRHRQSFRITIVRRWVENQPGEAFEARVNGVVASHPSTTRREAELYRAGFVDGAIAAGGKEITKV